MKKDVMITCAVTGGADTTSRNPHIPVSPEEIARNVSEVAAAGATMAHIHVRDPETRLESWRKEHFIEVVDRIRDQGTDIIINLTSAIGIKITFDSGNPSQLDPDNTDFWHPERRLEHIEAAMPDVCSLDVPIMNYNDTPYCNLPEHVRILAGRVKEIGVKPEIEAFDLGDMWRTYDYIGDGLFDDPPLIQLCMGVKYGVPATTRGIVAMCDMLPENCVWGAFGIGARQFPMVAQSVLLGGNVRVGLEDNLYLEKGVPATNVQLVEGAVEIIERLGSNVSTVGDA
ncbi:MAG: 3-keto-5-aminohexanoate cleavage protein, partial [Gammaproteobacteria bacterium]|nr:3-keto-5-aminohexanoate cleavage protein [Gammaproteobacteria bacterium]